MMYEIGARYPTALPRGRGLGFLKTGPFPLGESRAC